MSSRLKCFTSTAVDSLLPNITSRIPSFRFAGNLLYTMPSVIYFSRCRILMTSPSTPIAVTSAPALSTKYGLVTLTDSPVTPCINRDSRREFSVPTIPIEGTRCRSRTTNKKGKRNSPSSLNNHGPIAISLSIEADNIIRTFQPRNWVRKVETAIVSNVQLASPLTKNQIG